MQQDEPNFTTNLVPTIKASIVGADHFVMIGRIDSDFQIIMEALELMAASSDQYAGSARRTHECLALTSEAWR